MSRADVHAARVALRVASQLADAVAQLGIAEAIHEAVAMLDKDIADRDAERDRGRRRRDRPPDVRAPSTGQHPDKSRTNGGRMADEEGGKGGDLSSLHEIINKSESKSARAHAGERPLDEPGREPLPSIAPTPRLIDPKLTLDDETRAYAAQLGIQEIDVQWRRFVDKSIARGETSVDHRALFRSRLAFVRNDERRERQKDSETRLRGAPQNGPVDKGDPYHEPAAVAARQRSRDREHEALKRQRAGPQQVAGAVGSVLAAIGQKPTEEGQPKKANGGAT